MDDQNTKSTEHSKAEAQQSFTGKTLTSAQLDVAWSITSIMKRGIEKSATFHEPLMDYSHAFARTEKFDQLKGETIIRDIFKARFGQTMNQMREDMVEREAQLGPEAKEEALEYARRVLDDIQQGETMPFYAASDRQAQPFAKTFSVTEVAAKKTMSAAFKEAEGNELYDVGKELEKEHHLPKREAEREAKRTASKTRAMSHQR